MLDELQVKFTLSQGLAVRVCSRLKAQAGTSQVCFSAAARGARLPSQKRCYSSVCSQFSMRSRRLMLDRDVKMQNILLNAKGVVKLGELCGTVLDASSFGLLCAAADFGMARPYSPRPLTAGVVTIWYRAPEILLGTKNYTPSIDLWSAGLVLAELLQSAPLLTGENPFEQLSLIVKLLGSPAGDDLATLAAMGCPELINWRRESLASGRADNMERRFLAQTSPETVNFLRGLLTWSPQFRWTAAEALGKGKTLFSAAAERWWKESPRAADKEFLPTYPEVRNREAVGGTEHRGRNIDAQEGRVEGESTDGYVFDFESRNLSRRSTKRPRLD